MSYRTHRGSTFFNMEIYQMIEHMGNNVIFCNCCRRVSRAEWQGQKKEDYTIEDNNQATCLIVISHLLGRTHYQKQISTVLNVTSS